MTSALSHAQSELARITAVQRRLDDLEVLVELVNAEDDEAQAAETAAEAESELAGVQATIDELEVQTLLNGEYDPRPAVVTIRAGAGGVDAADFAEMLLRMYLRWAEQHKYSVTVWTPPTRRRRASSPPPSRSTPPTRSARSPSRRARTGSCG